MGAMILLTTNGMDLPKYNILKDPSFPHFCASCLYHIGISSGISVFSGSSVCLDLCQHHPDFTALTAEAAFTSGMAGISLILMF